MLSFLAIAACSSEDEPCLCTEEFRMIAVTVVDGGGAPVDGATVAVMREINGDALPFGAPGHMPGMYVVYDDSRTASTRPGESIRVTGSKDALTFDGVIQVTVDLPCRCHISKAGGPDTLVAQ
jgi:hypothetical protein